MTIEGSILGNSVMRVEDDALLRGVDDYFDDIEVAGLAHVHFVRSTVAHGSIGSIDTAEAETMPGIAAVYTAESLALPPIEGFPVISTDFARPPLAAGTVRFVGDIIAAVVAESRAQAVDGAEAVVVEIGPLVPVVTPLDSLAEGAPILFAGHGSNVCFEHRIGEDGDPDPLAEADHVVEVTLEAQRLAGVPIEPNGALVVPDGRAITCYFPNQTPIGLRAPIANDLGMDVDDVRVIAPAVGGGFGSKAGLYPEFLITASAARALDRPVKWTEGRSESMVAMLQGRGMALTARLGLASDGRFVGLEAEVVGDAGAYPGFGSTLPRYTGLMIQGVYDIPQIAYRAVSVVTNTTPVGAYRGAGRPEAVQMVERLVDLAALDLEIDPAELRRMNYLHPDSFPITTAGGAHYDSGDYERALDTALDVSGYRDLRAEQEMRRTSDATRQLGVGIASYVEVTSGEGVNVEYGRIEVNGNGTVDAYVGTSAHGQGHVTSFSMIVAEQLGVPMDHVNVIQSDTDRIPRGVGTVASRSLQTAGSAVHIASEAVLQKAKTLAAHLLEADPADIVRGEGGLHVAGVPANVLSWADLARAADDASRRPDGMDPGLSYELDFEAGPTYPFGTHVAVVEVDTETGEVTLLRHVSVDDCGTILNPLIVRGQQHGGIAQGAAQALFEKMRFDEVGNPVTANLADYTVPSAAELPFFEATNTVTATPRNPLGAKGIGEAGTVGATPAIHNAVVDAISHLGVRHIDTPLTAMAVWEALQEVG